MNQYHQKLKLGLAGKKIEKRFWQVSVMGGKKSHTLGAITRGFLWVGKCIIGRCVKYENDESATNLISFRVLLANVEEEEDDDENDEDCSSITVFLRVQKMRSKS